MMSGLDFDSFSAEIVELRQNAAKLKLAINQCIDDEERLLLHAQLFGRIGRSLIQPPFHCEFGKTISIGESTFINMNVVMLDNAPITIGNNVLIGPSSQFIRLLTRLVIKRVDAGKRHASRLLLKMMYGLVAMW